MSCIYNQSHDCDKCDMFDEKHHDKLNIQNSEYGFSVENDGSCSVDDDPDPYKNCSMFEPIDSEVYND